MKYLMVGIGMEYVSVPDFGDGEVCDADVYMAGGCVSCSFWLQVC
jgi:hypothetical protein